MVWEARVAFVLFFILCWCIMGLIPWAVAAVVTRGRGALLAFPLAIGAACAAGIVVPLAGMRDGTGFSLSLGTAMVGSALGSVAGIAAWRRLQAMRPAPERPAMEHPIGAPRPVAPEK